MHKYGLWKWPLYLNSKLELQITAHSMVYKLCERELITSTSKGEWWSHTLYTLINAHMHQIGIDHGRAPDTTVDMWETLIALVCLAFQSHPLYFLLNLLAYRLRNFTENGALPHKGRRGEQLARSNDLIQTEAWRELEGAIPSIDHCMIFWVNTLLWNDPLKVFPSEIVYTTSFGGDVSCWSRVLVSISIQLLVTLL